MDSRKECKLQNLSNRQNNDDFVSEYLIVKSSALPEVYNNVMKVKELLQSGDVNSVNEAVKQVGVSRSAFYKYRDDVQAWQDPNQQNIITITVTYEATSEALSELVYRLSINGNKLLNVAQSLPRSGFTDVMLSCTLGDEDSDLVALRRNLARIAGVRQVEIFAD